MPRAAIRAKASTALSILFLVILGASGCGKGQAGSFKVGVVMSLDGPSAPLGQSEQRSVKLVGDPRIGDKRVEFLVEDDESDPAKASAAAVRLINREKVEAIIGASTTGCTLAMVPIVEEAEVPLVSMAAGTRITSPVKKWVFSVAPNDALVIERVLMYFEEHRIRRIALLHDANAYGTGGADELQAEAGRFGVEVVARESYGSADTDMTPQLTKIAETDAEALLVWGTNPGPASIARNMRQLDMRMPFVGSSGIANQKFIELAGVAAEGAVFPASRFLIPQAIPPGSTWAKTVEEFSSAYSSEFSQQADTFAAHGWDACNIVIDALERAGDGESKLRAEIEKTRDFAGADGVFNYSKLDHAGLDVSCLTMVQIQNGAWVPAK